MTAYSVRRPSIGNTYAVDRFTVNGPTGYVPVYPDGSHGPTYETRREAEADYGDHLATGGAGMTTIDHNLTNAPLDLDADITTVPDDDLGLMLAMVCPVCEEVRSLNKISRSTGPYAQQWDR